MADDDYTAPRYSPFWPIVLFVGAFLISSIVQLVEVFNQRSLLQKAYQEELAALPKAQVAQTRLVSLMNDLMVTSTKDPNAAQVIREAKAAGFIHDSPSTNAPAAAGP